MIAHSNNAKATIALIDFERTGHHEMYFCKLESYLLDAGFTVKLVMLDEGWKQSIHASGRFRKRFNFWNELSKRVGIVDMFFFAYFDSACEFWPRYFRREVFANMAIWGIWMNSWGFRRPGKIEVTPKAVSKYRFLQDPAISLFLLDESVASSLQGRVAASVYPLPDFSDFVMSGTSEIRDKIVLFANGRRVLLLWRPTGPKRVDLFLEVVRGSFLDSWCYVIVGTGASKHAESGDLSDKLLAFDTWVRDEAEMNTIIGCVDVIWCIYEDWEGSSNLLTKAAMLRKEVIVASGYLMAERVRQYGLGGVVSGSDPHEVLDFLKAYGNGTSIRTESQVEAFKRDFSDEVVVSRLLHAWERRTRIPAIGSVRARAGRLFIDVTTISLQFLSNALKSISRLIPMRRSVRGN